MADDVAITAGSGTNIATDDCTSGHVQVVKLAYSADGTRTHVPADADGVLVNLGTNNDVTVTTLPALVAGSANIGDVDVLTLPALVASSANIGDVDVLTVPEHAGVAADVMNATSGDTFTALTNSAQVIKASAGKLLGWYIYNPNTVASYVVFYNIAAASVTVGTSTSRLILAIPALSAANLWCQPGGISFGSAMSWAAATTAAGNGAPTTALEANAFWI